MIKCVIKGSSNDIISFQKYLKSIYKNYSNHVVEQLPEAVVHGVKSCTAVFLFKESFVDVYQFNKFFYPEIKFFIADRIYRKAAKTTRGCWDKNLKNKNFFIESSETIAKSSQCNSSESEEIEEFEEVEHWELRHAGKL